MVTEQNVLDFWYGPLREDGSVAPDRAKRWWKKDPSFDALIAEQFGETLAAARRGECEHWATTPEGRTALVILLDQLSRNAHRDTPDAFAADPRALSHASAAADAGELLRLPALYGYFLLMPFMHSEDIATQERGVALFSELANATPAGPPKQSLVGAVDFAKRHRDIVQRFGRFPHRNAILGRESSAEEVEFLKQPGSSF